MNQIFAFGLTLIIALLLWSSRKPSKRSAFFKSQNDSFSESQIATTVLINKKSLPSQKSIKLNNKESTFFLDQPSFNSIETKKQLSKLIAGNPNDRLLAIQIASKWKNSKALPFLRIGLKDSDCRVVIASAAGILSHKGKTINSNKKSQTFRLPRNVSLMR